MSSKDSFLTDYVIMSLTLIQQTLGNSAVESLPSLKQTLATKITTTKFGHNPPSLEKQKLLPLEESYSKGN